MKTLFILSLIFSVNAYSGSVGTVTMKRGSVTILQPNAMKAIPLKKGMKVYESSSILSMDKSFARIKLKDNTVINLGPSSKMVITAFNQEDKSLIGLLKGKIRATVEKKGRKNRVFIRTKTAALGVRGTDFQTSFDPETYKTTLLTYEGSVAIKNMDPMLDQKVVNSKALEKTKIVSKVLENEDQVAEVGDFTLVNANKAATEAVKINPTQLVILEKDKSLGVEKVKIDKKVLGQEVQAKTAEMKQNAKQRGMNLNDGKSLGLLDVETGFYIPKQNGKAIGKIDSNGKYYAPKGLKIDKKKGFIALNDNKQAQAKNLNDKLLNNQIYSEDELLLYKKFFQMGE